MIGRRREERRVGCGRGVDIGGRQVRVGGVCSEGGGGARKGG